MDERHCQHCGALLVARRQRHCHECGRKLRELDYEEILNYGECPECGSYSMKVTTTSKPTRSIKCNKCGKSFKTVEVFLKHPDALNIASEMLREVKI